MVAAGTFCAFIKKWLAEGTDVMTTARNVSVGEIHGFKEKHKSLRYMALKRNIRALLVDQECKSVISLGTELQGKAEQIHTGDDSWSRRGAKENWVMDNVYHETSVADGA